MLVWYWSTRTPLFNLVKVRSERDRGSKPWKSKDTIGGFGMVARPIGKHKREYVKDPFTQTVCDK